MPETQEVTLPEIEVTLSKIREKFDVPPLHIEIRKLPFYISSFLKEDRDVIFINEQRCRSKVDQYSYKNIGSITFDADVTGQPLEAPHSEFDSINLSHTIEVFEEVTEVDTHAPIPIRIARSILNYCNLSLKPNLPIWILTDASDIKSTVLLSVEHQDSGWTTRSWLMDKGFMVPPTLESLLDQHCQFSHSSPQLVDCEVKCTYDVHKLVVANELHSSMSVLASWNKLSLEPPLLHRSIETRLVTKVRIGFEKGGLELLWKQLRLLDNYLNLISEISAANCAVPVLTLPSAAEILDCLGLELSGESALSRVRQVLMEPVKVSLGPTNGPPTLEQLIKQYSFTHKPTTDLTDSLWFLFIECKTYQELSGCLEELFMEIKKINAPAPFLNTSNISRLGRALLGGGVTFHDPIEYLVEIGIEKLRKEMLLIFSKAQIATGTNLNMPKFPNFSEISRIHWLTTARKWHLWLSQVHCALEILSRIQDSLSLSNAALYSIAPTILTVFTKEDSRIQCFNSIVDNPLQEVETSIPVKNVEKIIANKSPTEWVFSLTSSLKTQKCQTIYYKTSRKNCFPAVEKKINVDEDLTLPHDAYLFQWYEFRSVSQLFT